MKSTSEKKRIGPRSRQFLALWGACMLMLILHAHWMATQPDPWNDPGRQIAFAESYFGYTGIAIFGAIFALLLFIFWRAGSALYRRIAK
jgi:hypothetical protein